MMELEKNYIPTKVVKEILKIQDCDVMHLRESGKIKFLKKGNAFFYLQCDVEALVKDKPINKIGYANV